jgi:hypothetical protein
VQPDGVGEQRFLFGVNAVRQGHDRVGDVNVHEPFSSRAPGAQHVQANPADDRGQPGLHVLDVRRVLVADAKPRFL